MVALVADAAPGALTLAIPLGSPYTVTAKGAAAEGTGTWTGSITSTTPATTITVR